MKIIDVEQKTPEWLEIRWGKITGTGLKRLLGTPKAADTLKYEILAQRLSVANADDDEKAMDRGVRLESEAIAAFEKKTGKKVTTVGFIQSDFDKNVGCSPDGMIKKGKSYPEQLETKCLTSANHVRAWVENRYPEEHKPQIVMAFISNEQLRILWFVMYDPRIAVKPLLIFKITREELEQDIKEAKVKLKEALKWVEGELDKRVKI